MLWNIIQYEFLRKSICRSIHTGEIRDEYKRLIPIIFSAQQREFKNVKHLVWGNSTDWSQSGYYIGDNLDKSGKLLSVIITTKSFENIDTSKNGAVFPVEINNETLHNMTLKTDGRLAPIIISADILDVDIDESVFDDGDLDTIIGARCFFVEE